MEKIPEDIQKSAQEAYTQACRHTNQAEIIARAILAERRRCANIAEQADIDNATALWVKDTILSGEPQ